MQTAPASEKLLAFPRLETSDSAKLLVESGRLFLRLLEAGPVYETFKNIVEGALDADAVIVSSYSPANGMIKCEFAWVVNQYLDPKSLPPVPFEAEPGFGMQSEVIRTGETLLFKDVAERVEEGKGTYYEVRADGSCDKLEKGSRPERNQYAIMAPLKLDNEVTGVVHVSTEGRVDYGPQHTLFVEGLAVQLAGALKNAELFSKMQEEISERARAERLLREREQEVQSLNSELEGRVASKTKELDKAIAEMNSFCYSVSHDLRTPLRGISGSAMILLEDYGGKLDDEGKENLRAMRESASKMGKIIDGLLNFSRLSRNAMEVIEIDLSELASHTLARLAPQGSAHLEMVVQPGMQISGDPTMVSMAMDHLLSNGVKFSSRRDAPRVEVGTMELDNETVYFVKDNGVGFDPVYIEKIFKPFERLHSEHDFPGTGIGLANVKRIIERHNGRLWAEGEVGKGATFYFTIGELEPGS